MQSVRLRFHRCDARHEDTGGQAFDRVGHAKVASDVPVASDQYRAVLTLHGECVGHDGVARALVIDHSRQGARRQLAAMTFVDDALEVLTESPLERLVEAKLPNAVRSQ